MTHRFPIKEIARQSALSPATIDRVLNNRANVAFQTRKRVFDAINELEHQESQLSARGRRLFIDVVVEAPRRFSSEIRAALEHELPSLQPAVIRPRFNFQEYLTLSDLTDTLRRIAKRGSHGVLLKARDHKSVKEEIADLAQRGIPVITIFTDIPDCKRLAYAGANNAMAGKTAAYLIDRFLDGQGGNILLTSSQKHFRGEASRAEGFRTQLSHTSGPYCLLDASGGGGRDMETAKRVGSLIQNHRDIAAIYSIGGGNRAILQIFDDFGIRPKVFVAHDLDQENLALLRENRITAVLHHDLRTDMRNACQHIMVYHRLLPQTAIAPHSDIQIITPVNIPAFASDF